ncbi:MAG TPA: HAD family phosphatase [bacterium]|nr:HAD family phosphatase [bacterium]
MIRYNTAVAPLRALILDYGNVLTHPQAWDVIEAMAARLGVAVEAFSAAYWEHRRSYDAEDYTGVEYWRRVLRSVGRPEEAGEQTLLDWLIRRDGDSWMRYREDMWELANVVRTGGVRTAMLSNMSVELCECIRRDRDLSEWFDVVIVSGEVRMTKPDARIYRVCLERVDAEPAECLFVDDRPENVAAAQTFGMRTVHFVGDDAVNVLRAALAEAQRRR